MHPSTQFSLAAFRSDLPPEAVDEALRAAVAAHRHAERSVVLWFAEVKRRRLYVPLGFGSMFLYATESLEFSQTKTCQLLRIRMHSQPILRFAPRSRPATCRGRRRVRSSASSRTTRSRSGSRSPSASRGGSSLRPLRTPGSRRGRRAHRIRRRHGWGLWRQSPLPPVQARVLWARAKQLHHPARNRSCVSAPAQRRRLYSRQ